MTRFAWTDERVEQLKELWMDGYTCSSIAMRLGACSRSAVIGKVHRLGLNMTSPRREKPRKTKRPSPQRGAAARSDGRTTSPQPIPADVGMLRRIAERDAAIPADQRVTLDKLADTGCRYPIGDPMHADFGFCPGTRVPGLSYCPEHAAVCLQPVQTYRAVARAVNDNTSATPERELVEA